MIDERFYELVKHLWRNGSYAYWWTPDTDEGKLSIWFPADKPKPVNPLWKTINVYFPVHPSRTQNGMRQRAKVVDVEVVNSLFAEFDLADGQTKEHLLAAINQMDKPPSVIVFSGGGFHCYWLLEQSYFIDSDDARQRIIDIQYAWVDYTGSDDCAKDLARVLRVAGTFNRKPEFAPNYPQVEIVKFDLELQYSLDELSIEIEHLIIEAKAKRDSAQQATVVPVDLDDTTIIEKMLQRDPIAVALWDGDISGHSDDHSKADLALCSKLAFWFGCDRDRIDRVFRRSGLYRPKWLRDDYREKTIDKAITTTTSTYQPNGATQGNPAGVVGNTINFTMGSNGHSAQAQAGSAPASQTAAPPPSPPPAKSRRRNKSDDYIQALDKLGYQFRLNELDDTIEVNGKRLTDVIAAEIRTQMRDLGYDAMGAIEDAYLTNAGQNRFNPVKAYLKSLRWDGTDYIGILASFIKDGHTPIVYADGTQKSVAHVWINRWFIGSVARVFDQAQNPMLVIDGSQGLGKSHFVGWIGSGIPNFFIESAIRPDDKEYDRYLATKFVWEVAELGATTKRQDVEALKSFLTKRDVTFRVPYGKHAIVKPALSNFIGTINNETGFLTDITGSRRFSSMRVLSLDWAYKTLDINQLWAQAYALWDAGESYNLLPEEAQKRAEINAQYQIEDPYEAWVLKYYDVDESMATWRTTTQEVADYLQAKGLRGETRGIQMHISKTLKAMGLQQDSNARPRMWKGIRLQVMPKIP